jgi:hypothetical protein
LVAEKLVQAGESRQRPNAGWHDGWGECLAAGNPTLATGERLSASAEGHFKKSLGHSISRCARKRFAVMEAMKNEHPVIEMADALEVSASGYAEHLKKDERPRRREDQELGEKLTAIFKANRKTYGTPRLQIALGQQGIRCGKAAHRALAAPLWTASGAEEAISPMHHPKRSELARSEERAGQNARARSAQSNLGRRHHLHRNAGRLALSGGNPGSVFTQSGGVEHLRLAGHGACDTRLEASMEKTPAGQEIFCKIQNWAGSDGFMLR